MGGRKDVLVWSHCRHVTMFSSQVISRKDPQKEQNKIFSIAFKMDSKCQAKVVGLSWKEVGEDKRRRLQQG